MDEDQRDRLEFAEANVRPLRRCNASPTPSLTPISEKPQRRISVTPPSVLEFPDPTASRPAIHLLRSPPDVYLGTRQAQLARLQVHVLSAQVQDLAAPASGQHQEADRRRGVRR